jgi:C4-dicarboxylate-specific signal transduction histidine kinase
LAATFFAGSRLYKIRHDICFEAKDAHFLTYPAMSPLPGTGAAGARGVAYMPAQSQIEAERIGAATTRSNTIEFSSDARRLNDQLTHMARVNTLGDMAGRLAHELNQPLTAISNYAQGCANRLKAEKITSAELVTILDLIRDAALRAGSIVDRLRDFVRRAGPHQVDLALATEVQRLLDLLEPEIRQSRVKVEVSIADDVPPVQADETQIEQVIASLIRNAMEAMTETPPQERKLSIAATRNSRNEVEVAVVDRGCGLHGEVRNKLFEPFFSTKPIGLGMGLPISRSILQWHGGRIWFDENTQQGACFRFTLPIQRGEAGDGNGE